MTSGSGSDGTEGLAEHREAGRPALPYAKAFVLQFSTETDAQLQHAAGRVEHLQTGRRARFASTADMLKCLVALLTDDQTRQEVPDAERRGPGE